MAKKSKKKTNGEKADGKSSAESEAEGQESQTSEKKESKGRIGKERPIIRAIRVTQEILDAAKEYKKAKGVSFYSLGFEAISDRLVKEGFLKKEDQ